MVSPAQGSTDITLTGFLTPQTLPVSGKLFLSAQEGDAVLTGDRMLFGANVASLFPLSGPNNPAGNFFASQINDENGQLNTVETFGTRNANAAAGTNSSACRQGWDITAVNVSPLLTAGMTTAAIRFTTDGDLYVANCLGLQIDSEGAQASAGQARGPQFCRGGGGDRLHRHSDQHRQHPGRDRDRGGPAAGRDRAGSGLSDPERAALYRRPSGHLRASGGRCKRSDRLFGPGDRVAARQSPAQSGRATYVFEPFPGFPVESSSTSNEVSVYVIDPQIGVNDDPETVKRSPPKCRDLFTNLIGPLSGPSLL